MQNGTTAGRLDGAIPVNDTLATDQSQQHGDFTGKPASTPKPIPRLRVIPRGISLHYLVSRALRAFDLHGDVFQLVLPVPQKIFCLRRPDHIKSVTSLKQCGTSKPPNIVPKADYFMGDGVYNDLGGATWFGKTSCFGARLHRSDGSAGQPITSAKL